MPMYEYGCQECAGQFTLLRRMNQDDADITCPACGSPQIHRQFSVFASMAGDGATATSMAESFPTGGSCCSAGGCGCRSNN